MVRTAPEASPFSLVTTFKLEFLQEHLLVDLQSKILQYFVLHKISLLFVLMLSERSQEGAPPHNIQS